MNILRTKCKKADLRYSMTKHHKKVGHWHIKYAEYHVEHVRHISFHADDIIMAHVPLLLVAGIIKLSNSVHTRLTEGSCGKS